MICNTCKIDRDLEFFQLRNPITGNRRKTCKLCKSSYDKKRPSRAAEHLDRYYKSQEYYQEKQRQYYENNKETCNKQSAAYKAKKRRTDINERLRHGLRARLRAALKNGQKKGSAVRDLGCSIEDLKTHLESQFQPGMSWDNYGLKGWHIDHIEPLSKFDLTNCKEFKQACHFSNLQPLWAEDNLRKSNA